ncbi:MAG: hypothetical protein ACLPHP_11620 [Candidatus Sulfotelmatobacter sp.]
MSQQSKILAQQFEAAKEQKANLSAIEMQKKQGLDEGFNRLRKSLMEITAGRCSEVNAEAPTADLLVCTETDNGYKITRKDSGATLTLVFDAALRTATFKISESKQFKSVVKVSEGAALGSWYYTDGAGNSMGVFPDLCADVAVQNALHTFLVVG